MTNRNVYVGISGFSYAGWKGNFYPNGMKNEDLLGYYSQYLNSVEINSSFYAPPSAAMVKAWAAKTGDSFRFAFKAPKQITHILKLGRGSAEAAEKLSKTLDLMGPKRGPMLFQLPPYAKQDLKLLEEFLSSTSIIDNKVFEFRHESWLQQTTYELLNKYNAGFCIAETEDMEPVLKVTGGLAYVRLRKESYDKGTVDKWSENIRKTMKDSKETYVYLRHDETGENAALAQRLAKKI